VLAKVGITRGMDVVDLCSGDGWFTLHIAKIARHVTGIHIDRNLLDVARMRLAEQGVANCDFVAGDAYDVAKFAADSGVCRRRNMKASDVMTVGAATIRSDASVPEAARLMLQYAISGLPVVDDAGHLVGIVTEGDFLRRTETGTERQHRPRWLEFLLGPGRLADEYVHSHSRKVEEVMTRQVVTVAEETPVDEIARLMERHRIKRVPVIRDNRVVGIVSRANLLRGLARLADAAPAATANDLAIREQILAELDAQAWGRRAPIDVTVRNGIVQLWGPVPDDRVAQALRVAAENVPGVKRVEVTTLP
jgi:CBS domain-containing protein